MTSKIPTNSNSSKSRRFICPICRREVADIYSHLKRTHRLTGEEYRRYLELAKRQITPQEQTSETKTEAESETMTADYYDRTLDLSLKEIRELKEKVERAESEEDLRKEFYRELYNLFKLAKRKKIYVLYEDERGLLIYEKTRRRLKIYLTPEGIKVYRDNRLVGGVNVLSRRVLEHVKEKILTGIQKIRAAVEGADNLYRDIVAEIKKISDNLER